MTRRPGGKPQPSTDPPQALQTRAQVGVADAIASNYFFGNGNRAPLGPVDLAVSFGALVMRVAPAGAALAFGKLGLCVARGALSSTPSPAGASAEDDSVTTSA